MKIAIFICSYNSLEYTTRVYNELKDIRSIDLYILDNSSKDNEIPNFNNTIHIGKDNVEFGGMHDWILNWNKFNDYDFIGIFNNDVFGFTHKHFDVLNSYLTDDIGYISFSISREYDKSANSMWTIPGNKSRQVSFIENVCPIYNKRVLLELKKYSPIHRYALIDYFMSGKSNELGLKNIIIDEVSFNHIRSGVRKLTGSFNDYINKHHIATNEWINKHPELIKYFH